jgi:4-amino-4-deoxychorismate lyase
MCLLLETVKVHHRQLQNIEAHTLRAAKSRHMIFGLEDPFDLCDYISLPDDLDDGIYKCRIIYGQTVQHVELLPYLPKKIQTLRLVVNDELRYEHKYLDRSSFDKFVQSAFADDVLIVQHGRITDSSFSNIVFYDGKKWVTPAQPLFRGIKRQILIEKELVHEEEVTRKDLHRFMYAALINAILDIGDTAFISIENILPPI